jgi:hypothetical protein
VTELIDSLEQSLAARPRVRAAETDTPASHGTDADSDAEIMSGTWHVSVSTPSNRSRVLTLSFLGIENVLTLYAGVWKDKVTINGMPLSLSVTPGDPFSVTRYHFGLRTPFGESHGVLAYSQAAAAGPPRWVTLDVDGARVYTEGSPPT